MTQDVPAPPPAPIAHQIRRNPDDRMIAGVCGGLAMYLGVDPTLVRVGAVVLGLMTGGTAVIGYVVAWLLMPEARPGEMPAAPARERHPEAARFIVGAALIGLGGLWLLGAIVPGLLASRVIWPLVLVGVGVFLVVRGAQK